MGQVLPGERSAKGSPVTNNAASPRNTENGLANRFQQMIETWVFYTSPTAFSMISTRVALPCWSSSTATKSMRQDSGSLWCVWM
jgi:hypothetical protein